MESASFKTPKSSRVPPAVKVKSEKILTPKSILEAFNDGDSSSELSDSPPSPDSELESEEEEEDSDSHRGDELTVRVKQEHKVSKSLTKSRRTNPGRRVVGGRVYDSVYGQTCHWCRQKTVEDHVECSRCKSSRFCGLCLLNRNGEVIKEEMGFKWVCPKCRGGCGPGCTNCCNCGPCRKNEKKEPTGQIVRDARAKGFSNAHDYLVYLVTEESPESIAKRKENTEWTRASGAREQTADEIAEQDHLRRTVEKMKEMSDADDDCQEQLTPYSNLRTHRAGLKRIVKKGGDSKINGHHNPPVSKEKGLESWLGLTGFQTPKGLPDSSGTKRVCVRRNLSKNWVERTAEEDRCDGSNQVASRSGDDCSAGISANPMTEEEIFTGFIGTLDEVDNGWSCLPSTEYKRKLDCCLKQPFSSNKLCRMMSFIRTRKPLMRTRHTRRSSFRVPCSSSEISLLDYYPDLNEKINKAQSSPEELMKLVLGFLFWLKYASMEGAFRPWITVTSSGEDKSGDCIEVEGPDCEIIAEFVDLEYEPVTSTLTPGEFDDVKPVINAETKDYTTSRESLTATKPLMSVKKEKLEH